MPAYLAVVAALVPLFALIRGWVFFRQMTGGHQ